MNDLRFNAGRRQALKVMGVAATAVALPSWIKDAQASLSGTNAFGAANAANAANGIRIAFTDSHHAGAQLVSLTNESGNDMTIRHIYPGIVNAAGKTYDLNDLTDNGVVSIPAGSTQIYRVTPIERTRSEKALPEETKAGKALQVSTLDHSFNQSSVVTTTRYFLA